MYMLFSLACGMLCLVATGCNLIKYQEKDDTMTKIQKKEDIAALFPKTVTELESRVQASLVDAKKKIDALVALPKANYSYATVAQPLDELDVLSNMAIMMNVCTALENVCPDEALRTAAHDAVKKLQEFRIDVIDNNKAIYDTFVAYATDVAPHEQLTDEQRYYISETLKSFKRRGFDLPDEQRNECAKLAKEIAQLSQDFERNIAQDQSTVSVSKDELAGVDPEFVAQLKTDAQGQYILGVDYPTVFTIFETCSVESTRKKMYLTFNNRAYPANQPILERLIAARDELAQLLSMPSYATLCLADEMVETPERAYTFLYELLDRSNAKQLAEFKLLTSHLPQGVTLTEQGYLKPWDVAYVKDNYKKKYLAVDEQSIAHYFPSASTIAGLLSLYEQFFNLSFKHVEGLSLWANNLTTIAVFDAQDKKLLGYLILDLYPRAHKFTHACHMDLTPSIIAADGSKPPSVSLVLANFPPDSANKPALYKRDDVNTFFHEFGHALHALLGRTRVASFSGTHVKYDFVEMPSQMLEQWLNDSAILKKISKHYITGEPLPDELIAAIDSVKNFDSGYHIQRQAFLSLVSLSYYGPGAIKDCNKIWETLLKKCVPTIAYEPQAHMYLSFGHLPGYGPRYYGYLWSKVFALDLFESIKKQGLLNPQAGKLYVDKILSHGGSKNPNELLKSYLGREPRQDAFFADIGL